MNKGYFDPLLDIKMPKLQIAKPLSSGSIATGPFAVVHNGTRGIGSYLHQYLDVVAFLDSSIYRSLTQDYIYEIDEKKNSIRFFYEDVSSEFIIEPIIESDIKEFYPDNEFKDLPEFVYFLERKAQQITLGPHIELTDYAVTIDGPNRQIYGLFKRDEKNFYRREAESWVKLTSNDEDWVDIEEYEWVNVLSGAISTYDQLANEEIITIDPFKKYLIG